MPRPADLIDREPEWQRLEAYHASPRSELVFVLGRRRVGKTFLLAPFAREVGGVYYQATRRTEAEQLRELSRQLGQRFGDDVFRRGAALPDWAACLEYVRARAGADPFLLVLDEFPYLVEAAPSLPSVLQAFLDHAARDARLKIVLCGSAITTMKHLEGPEQPLYARRTGRIHLQPFPSSYVRAFVPDLSPTDCAKVYGAFGGLPGHLALLDPELAFEANVVTHMLDPSSRLFDEAQHMLDAFLGEAQVHYSVLAAIAGGQTTWGGITKTVGKSSGSVSRPMDWLIDMEIVRRVVPVTQRAASRSRRTLYRIRDPYVAFWHRFVAPIVRRGGTWLGAPDDLYRTRIAPRFDDYMGPVFEEMCRAAVPHLEGLPFRPIEVGEWWGRDPDVQIDVVAFGGNDDVLVGEVKWGQVGRRDLAALRERAAALGRELGRPVRVHTALFSGRGIADADTAAAVDRGEALHFGLDDILRPNDPRPPA